MSQYFEQAAQQYGELGIDVKKAFATLEETALSLHCWQGDDVGGFENPDSKLSGGGIQVTGNYPGKARDIGELRQDVEYAMQLITGKHRLNLHAIYGDFSSGKADRNEIELKHYQSWMDWSRDKKVSLDFNATCFSHPKADDGFTLASYDKGIRDFWIEHVKRCRNITAAFGRNQGNPSVHNLWIPDGTKDYTVDRLGYRKNLLESLDTIYADVLPDGEIRDAVESKLFGIGSETYVVGSHEFYLSYALTRNKLICLDLGHFHPTESLADKLSALFLYTNELLLHVSRPMRWDSDHVVLFNDDIRQFMSELVRSGGLGKTHIGLDFFDATLNRIGAWAIGARSTLKGLLYALLEPKNSLMEYEHGGNNFGRLALLESGLTLPFGEVWNEFCRQNNAPTDLELIDKVHSYEKTELAKRV